MNNLLIIRQFCSVEANFFALNTLPLLTLRLVCCIIAQNLRLKGGNNVSQVKVKDNESLESALRRFKRQTSRDGVIQEVRKREHYEKPSVKRKKKSEAARERKYK